MDDDRESAMSIIMNLRDDFNIEYYPSATNVIKAIHDGKAYDVLVLDYDMSNEGTGIEVLKEIKKNIYYIPAIMISAVVYNEVQVQEAMNAGFAKYFAKHDPRLIVKLRAAVIELVAQSLDPVTALDKWVKVKKGRENDQISLGQGVRTISYILDKLKNDKNMDPNQRMILVRCMLDYMIAEDKKDGVH